jgi:hypothetical protein
MLLVLENGDRVLVENKIDAAETKQEQDDGTVLDQVVRYLALAEREGYLGVAYVRENTTPKGVAAEVLNHARYIRPATNQHFLWRHFFEAFAKDAPPLSLTGMLRGYFEHCGYTQPLPSVGSMSNPENQLNFAKLLEPTLAAIRNEGWSNVSVNKFAELYAEGHASGAGLLVSPNRSDGTRLLVRLSPWQKESESQYGELEAVANVVSVSPVRLQRSKGPVLALDILLDLNALLKDLQLADRMADVLCEAVLQVLRTAFSGLPAYEKV